MLRKLLNTAVLFALGFSPLALTTGCASDDTDRPHSLTGDSSTDNHRPVYDDKGHRRIDLEH